MKKILIGKQGTGKTTLIINEFIPKLNNYLVFDFCNEYSQFITDKDKIKTFDGIIGKALKNQVTNTIRQANDDVTLIIDNTQLIYFPKLDSENNFKSMDTGFEWLYDELKNKKFILVFQSIKSVIEGNAPDLYDEIHCFNTFDDDNIRTCYIDEQIHKGINVNVIS